MNDIKFFEADDQILSLHILSFQVPTLQKDLLILIEEPFTKKKDVVMIFNKDQANELLKELKRLVALVNFLE